MTSLFFLPNDGQDKNRLPGLAAIVGLGLIWTGWMIFKTNASMMLLGLGAGVLAFLRPGWALVLLSLTVPFETQFEMQGLGTVHTGEWMLVMILPGLFHKTMARFARGQQNMSVALWTLPFVIVMTGSAFRVITPESMRGMLKWLEMILVFILTVHVLPGRRAAELIFWALGFSGILLVGQGFFEMTSGKIDAAQVLTIATAYGERVRAGAGFGPNGLAVFVALVLPFFMSAALFHPRGGLRLAGIIGGAVLALGIGATLSLSGWMLLGVAAMTVVVWIGIQKPRFLIYMIIVAIATFSVVILLHPDAAATSFWQTKAASLHDRWDYCMAVVSLLSHHFWLGVGPGMYRFTASLAAGSNVNPVGLITHPHSLWLTAAAEGGILGLAGLVWLFAKATTRLVHDVKQLPFGWPTAAGIAMVAGWIGLMAANCMDHCMIHDRGVYAALYLGAALAFVRGSQPQPDKSSRMGST